MTRNRNDGGELPRALIDEEMERLVLGSVIVDETSYRRMAPFLSEEDFTLRKYQLIWRSVVELSEAGEPVDRITVYDWLLAHNETGEVGGLSALMDLDNGLPKLIHPEAYAKILRAKSQQRRVYQEFTHIAGEAALGIEKTGELLQRARLVIEEIRSLDISLRPENAGDFIAGYPGGLTGFLAAPPGSISYPFETVQRHTGGLRAGELTVLAARPSMGKTAFALNVSLSAARAGKRVGVFSLEMSKHQLCNRLLCEITQINLFDFTRGQVAVTKDVQDAYKVLQELPLFLNDRLKTIAEIRRNSELSKYDLVVIDYLGLLDAPGRYENRNIQLSAMSRQVKLMAHELGIPVLAVHQLNRQPEGRADHRPELHDLRDSGSLEQDADVVMLLYRPCYYKRDDPSLKYSAELLIRKQRNGPIKDLPLQFFAEFVTFSDPLSTLAS